MMMIKKIQIQAADLNEIHIIYKIWGFHFHHEDEDSTFPWNVLTRLPDYMVS
jgi:hypothetical protein